jgi:hypothetical protein
MSTWLTSLLDPRLRTAVQRALEGSADDDPGQPAPQPLADDPVQPPDPRLKPLPARTRALPELSSGD